MANTRVAIRAGGKGLYPVLKESQTPKERKKGVVCGRKRRHRSTNFWKILVELVVIAG